ncbi:hypothetical protein NB231_17348 [Nitrococcus mobilis Nb-231]|uniref:IrrE N-terminal-like domain-containing protein n=2 Tax=Nitrococcus mobilis TaxID=35797 RepID=A4BMS0_9GAMM|nr:hypothetical protein NB231_17348 [Nitrococcus mobilis Nb-231]
MAALGAHDPCLFLGFADEQHALVCRARLQIALGAVVLALAALEGDEIDAFLKGKAFHGRDEAPGHRCHADEHVRFYVYCNSPGVDPNSDPRTRFTLGHEAGHYFMGEHLDSAVLILWKDGELEWWRPLRTWGFERARSSVASISELVFDSATEKFINGTTDPSDGVHAGGHGGILDKKGVPAWHHRNQILIEEVMSLGRYGYLTLLYPDSSSPCL